MFCEYSNIFGKPGKGIHSIRLFDIAIIDVIFTILIAYLINLLWFEGNNFLLILLVLFICGIIFHRLFCVNTTINKILFN